jgi:hypothetical protein
MPHVGPLLARQQMYISNGLHFSNRDKRNGIATPSASMHSNSGPTGALVTKRRRQQFHVLAFFAISKQFL